MAQITYISHDGKITTVDVAPGMTVMEGAIRHGVGGIDAECGGACACATCHVYVEEAWLKKTGERTEIEEAMLEMVTQGRTNSRLACQIRVTEELAGLIVRCPESQH